MNKINTNRMNIWNKNYQANMIVSSLGNSSKVCLFGFYEKESRLKKEKKKKTEVKNWQKEN
jgi:hypothetical protein